MYAADKFTHIQAILYSLAFIVTAISNGKYYAHERMMSFLSFWPYHETFKASVCWIITSPQIATTYYLGNEDADVTWPFTTVTL